MLCGKNDETFNQLVFHTEVRWLSKTNCIERLVDLYYSTVEFLADVNQTLCEELKKCKNHPFYISDLYSKFNEIQKRLQGLFNDFWPEEILSAFEVYRYWKKEQMFHTKKVRKDFKVRFEDGEKKPVPDWIITPFDIEI
ncbi:Protein ZBED8 [Trichinella murrelli]|uniref:Protein ZBED8 n=1 Tax=Trichinella murrelli TaxID=144512 RepID=A0A0V0TV21_9BILA|nr:Protein ZBED8 [Trichinella murrelli]